MEPLGVVEGVDVVDHPDSCHRGVLKGMKVDAFGFQMGEKALRHCVVKGTSGPALALVDPKSFKCRPERFGAVL